MSYCHARKGPTGRHPSIVFLPHRVPIPAEARADVALPLHGHAYMYTNTCVIGERGVIRWDRRECEAYNMFRLEEVYPNSPRLLACSLWLSRICHLVNLAPIIAMYQPSCAYAD